MAEERKKVSPEQLKLLIVELENDKILVSGREGRAKADYCAKWEQLAKKLNSIESGALKSVTKWQQSLRDWKNNTKKKATKLETNRNPQSDGSQDLNSLELRLLALYNHETVPAKPVGIDISSIAEVDPLSSENNSDEEFPYPTTFTTYTCDVRNESSSCSAEQTECGDQFKVKRRRVQTTSEDVINQQTRLLERLTALETSRQESENRQNRLLEAVSVALDRHAGATASLARAADAQAHLMTQILGVLQERRDDST